MDAKFIEKASGAMADKYRLAVLLELSRKGSLNCSDIQELTGLSQPCVSHHVRILSDSELVITRKEGRHLNISLNREKMKLYSGFISELAQNTGQYI